LGTRIPKTARNILRTIAIMLAIFLVGGTAYVFVADQAPAKQPAKPAASSESEPSILKPVAPAANAPEGVAIESLTSPVKAGDNSSLTVRTNAGSTCTISVTYNGIASKDSGLVSKPSDAYGFVTWAWSVPAATPIGTWPVNVTCAFHSKTGVVIGNLQVTK
jgi:hypothetical protein